MKPLYTRKTEITKKINSYFKTQKNWTPRAYRIYMGLSKQMLQRYKKNHTDWYDAIMAGQDKILATLEQIAIYNPELSRAQSTSIIFTLRAYDSEQYIPELRDKQIGYEQEKAIINLDFKQSKKKGER